MAEQIPDDLKNAYELAKTNTAAICEWHAKNGAWILSPLLLTGLIERIASLTRQLAGAPVSVKGGRPQPDVAQMTDEQIDAELRAYGLDPEKVVDDAFGKVCVALKESSAQVSDLTQQLAAQKKDWERLNRVFKTTSDKTIDQDIAIGRLEAERDQLRDALEKILYVAKHIYDGTNKHISIPPNYGEMCIIFTLADAALAAIPEAKQDEPQGELPMTYEGVQRSSPTNDATWKSTGGSLDKVLHHDPCTCGHGVDYHTWVGRGVNECSECECSMYTSPPAEPQAAVHDATGDAE